MNKLTKAVAGVVLAAGLALGAALPANAAISPPSINNTGALPVSFSIVPGGTIYTLGFTETAAGAHQLVVRAGQCVVYSRTGVSPITKCAGTGVTVRINLGTYHYRAYRTK